MTRLSSSSSKLKPDVVRPDANAGQVKPQWGQKLPEYVKNPHFKKLCFHDGFSKEFCTKILDSLSYTPIDKAKSKGVQPNGKTLQVLKKISRIFWIFNGK